MQQWSCPAFVTDFRTVSGHDMAARASAVLREHRLEIVERVGLGQRACRGASGPCGGKRKATPDLWRGLAWMPSKAISKTCCGLTPPGARKKKPPGPGETVGGVLADPGRDLAEFGVGQAGVGLGEGHQRIPVAHGEGEIGVERRAPARSPPARRSSPRSMVSGSSFHFHQPPFFRPAR